MPRTWKGPSKQRSKAVEAEIKRAKKEMRGSSLPMNEKLTEKRRISAMEGGGTR